MPATAQMQPALVLHVRPYRETSAIVQMLTQGQGRLAGVLRGYRSKKQGQVSVQPFSVGTVTYSGRSDLGNYSKV
jgi:DNA repair protein RecO (recombination protein O)